MWQTRQLCPGLVVIPPDYEVYERFFHEIKQGIFTDYTDQQEAFGSDESWLDVTGSAGLFGGGIKATIDVLAYGCYNDS